MSLDTRPPRPSPVRQDSTPRERDEQRGLPSRSLLVALVLACVSLMVVDRTSGSDSPVEPVETGPAALPAVLSAQPAAEPSPEATHQNRLTSDTRTCWSASNSSTHLPAP